jgi:hypothetical protein
VIDARGAPVAAARVHASPSDEGEVTRTWRGQCRTDAKGEFVITNCPDSEPFQISVSCDNDDTPRALVPSVRANGERVTIQLGRDGVAGSFLEAQFVELDGSPAPVSVLVRGGPRGVSRVHNNDPATGKLRLGPWHAGRYELQLARKPLGLLEERSIDVAENEVKDLGTIRLPATGSLALTIERPPGFAGKLVVKVESLGARWDVFGMAIHEDPNIPEYIALGPGAYHLVVSGSAITEVVRPFTIESGHETVLTIPVARSDGG